MSEHAAGVRRGRRLRAVRVAMLAGALVASASAVPPANASGDGAVPDASAAAALPELPRLAPATLPEPDASAIEDLERTLDRLTAPDDRTRESARSSLGDGLGPGAVPAIRHHVQELRASLDREAASRLLEEARKAGRKALRAKGGSEPDKGDPAKGRRASKQAGDDDGDWLDFVLAQPRPKDPAFRDLVRLLAMERMLAAVGTTPAVRELVSLVSAFGELVRVDVQRQIAKLRDKAVPALIEARQHDAKVIQRWASKQLDLLGRAIPGEAVSTGDTQVLADVLRAYGRTRDVDAARVVLSFCNADQIHVREAAREAVAAIGDAGIWQLRDVYLNMTGAKPPREWTWDRIARELFATYDRARMAEVQGLMDEGVQAAHAGKLEAAVAAFDKVLARAPLFDRRKEMVRAYVERAKQLPDGRREEALAMLRKALRLDQKGPLAKAVEAEAAYLEGALLVERGTPDRFILERALELDPSHARARELLASLDAREAPRERGVRRYAAAAAIGVAALVAMILLVRRREPAGGAPQRRPAGGGDPPRASPPAAPPAAGG